MTVATDLFSPIDFSRMADDPIDFATQLGRSFRETGFAVIENHGVDQGVIDRAEAAARAFFALPRDVKQAYYDPNGGGQRGYTPFGTENAKGMAAVDQKEFWHTGRSAPAGSHLETIMLPTPAVSEIAAFDASSRALSRTWTRWARNSCGRLPWTSAWNPTGSHRA